MKRLCCFLLAAMLLLSLSVAAAAQTLPLVIDSAELLSEAEELALTEELAWLGDAYGIDAVVLTTDSLNGQSAMAYADDYYDQHGYGADGVLLLVAMDERTWWISTSGSCIYKLDTDRLEDRFVSHLRQADYYGAFSSFVKGCEEAMSGASDQDAQTGNAWLTCLVIGAAVGLITVLVMKGQLKTVKSQNAAGSYVVGGLNLTKQSDIFLYHTTTRRAKPQNNSTHTSSSGRRHGGGGGRF